MIATTPLHPHFGKIVHDVDLRTVTADNLYPEIRQLFEDHTALLFPKQAISDDDHTRLAELFGPLENREAMAGYDSKFEVSEVSNVLDTGVTDPEGLHTLNLRANMLWHTDSTFLPIPALINILTAKIVPKSGGETELASTRVGWAHLPEKLKSELKDAVIWQSPVSFAVKNFR